MLCAAKGGRLKRLRQSASLKVLFPRCDGIAMHAILINTAGGATGGDRFDVEAEVAEGAHLVLSTQAAERAYRAQSGETASFRNRLLVRRNARLDWLPQEMLLYDGAALDRRLDVDLRDGSEFVMCEMLVLGRTAMGEVVRDLRLKDRIEIRRNGIPLLIEQIRFEGNAADHLSHRTMANGAGAMALVFAVSDRAEALVEPVRQSLPGTGGASLIQPGVLAVRILAADSFLLRQCLIPALIHLCGGIPKTWRI